VTELLEPRSVQARRSVIGRWWAEEGSLHLAEMLLDLDDKAWPRLAEALERTPQVEPR
jgi:hypothetical protein